MRMEKKKSLSYRLVRVQCTRVFKYNSKKVTVSFYGRKAGHWGGRGSDRCFNSKTDDKLLRSKNSSKFGDDFPFYREHSERQYKNMRAQPIFMKLYAHVPYYYVINTFFSIVKTRF